MNNMNSRRRTSESREMRSFPGSLAIPSMKQFLLLIKTTKDRLKSLSPEEQQRHVVNVRKFIQAMIANGQIITAQPVEMDGIILRGLRGAFQETRLDADAELIGAFYLVGAECLSDAVSFAKSDPRFEHAIWTMEIRPILHTDGISGG